MQRICLTIVFVAMFSCSTAAQFVGASGTDSTVGSPDWLIRMFFIEKSCPDLRLYGAEALQLMTEEMGGTWGAIRPPSSKVTYRLVQADLLNECYAVTTTDSGAAIDVYCYFSQNSGHWKFVAVRSLAMTGFAFALIQEYKKKEILSNEEQHELATLELQVASDSSLRDHLISNRSKFDTLASVSLSDSALDLRIDNCPKPTDSAPEDTPFERACSRLHILNVKSISRSYFCKECPAILVGGILDDRVYYLYCPDGKEPPRMSPDEFILVDKITDHWYLIKTT